MSMTGAIAMSRKPPPRREPNGRASRADQGADHSPAAIRRLRDAALRGMAAPEWGFEIGRLWLEGKLSARQYRAGQTFAELRHDYLEAIASPPEAPSVSIGERASRGHSDGAGEARKHMRDIRRYEDAIAAMGAYVPIVLLVSRRDTAIVGDALRQLQVGLTSLADHWGLPS